MMIAVELRTVIVTVAVHTVIYTVTVNHVVIMKHRMGNLYTVISEVDLEVSFLCTWDKSLI